MWRYFSRYIALVNILFCSYSEYFCRYLFRPQSHNPYLALNTDDAPSSPSSVVHSAGTELTHRGGGSVLVSIEDGTTGDESDDDGGDLESERLEMSAAHASAGSFLGKSTTTSLST